MFDPQESDELPPPAYELTQESFDQKTQHGIELSLEPQDPLHDLWEDWDDAKFEANLQSIANPSAPSSSSAQRIPPLAAHEYPKEKVPRPASPPPPQQEEPAVRPLKIVKKSQTAALKKAAEARSYQSNDFSADPTSANGGASLSRNFSMMSMGRRTPPPAFESNGPSYDGPEYEEMMMSYGYASGNARPESPGSILSADSYHSPALPPQQQMGNSRPNTNTALPPPPNPPIQYKPAPRPTQTQTQRPPFRPPGRLVGFDHMSAYKSKSAFTPGLESTPEKVDPSAFYNSAVSAHLSPIPQRQRTAIPQINRTNGYQQELQHPRPHHAPTFDNFSGTGNVGGTSTARERPVSLMSTDSSYYPTPPVNLTPNRGWAAFNPNR